MTELNKLNHPCKETCSGWQQGYEAGVAAQEENLKMAKLALDLAQKHLPSVSSLPLKMETEICLCVKTVKDALAKLRERKRQ